MIFFCWLEKYDRRDFLWDSVDSAGTSILAFAVSMNAPVDIIRTILGKLTPEQVNATDHESRTALHFAALLRRFDIIHALLARGADCSLQDRQGKTALEYLDHRSSHISNFLLHDRDIFPLRDEMAEYNALQFDWRVDLIFSKADEIRTKQNGVKVKKCFIPHREGLQAWAATKPNATAFIRSHKNQEQAIFINSTGSKRYTLQQILPELEKQRDRFSGTSLIDSIFELSRRKKCEISFKYPLLSAVEQGDLESVRLLLKNDSIDIHCTDPETSDTALDIALRGNNAHIILALCKAGVDSTIYNSDKTECEHTHADELESKAQEQQSENNKTLEHLLRLASASGGEKCEKLVKAILRRSNVDCNAMGEKTGKTALHWAIAKNNLEIAKELINRGAGLSICDARGRTPLQLMKDKGIDDLITSHQESHSTVMGMR